MEMLKRTVLLLVLLTLSAWDQGPAQGAGWKLVWSDEFEGPGIDTSVWKYEIGYIRNQELQYYTDRPENARVENGCLVIEARRDNWNGHEYTAASLNTRGTRSWKYGRIEMRAKLVKGKGMWPAFWAMGESGNWPGCGELDIMELIGGGEGYDDNIYGTIHWDDNGHQAQGGNTQLAAGVFADTFHVFGAEWDSLAVRWFLDGSQFFAAPLTDLARAEFHQRFWILVNLAVGGSWPGSPDAGTVFPQSYLIDWIRVYQPEGTVNTPGGNLILNPEFDLGTSFWGSQFTGGAAGTIEAVTGAGLSGTNALRVALTAPGTATWHGQITQTVPLHAGDTLDISFRARAAAAKDMDVLFQQAGSPWAEYFRQAVSVGTAAGTCGAYRFISPVTDPSAVFKFLVANNTTELWLDQVEVLLYPYHNGAGLSPVQASKRFREVLRQRDNRLFFRFTDSRERELTLTDMLGRAVYKGRYYGSFWVDLNPLGNGIYILEIKKGASAGQVAKVAIMH